MNGPLMPVMQIKIEALERQVAKLSEENERVRNLLTEFDRRHDADLARAEAAEAALVAVLEFLQHVADGHSKDFTDNHKRAEELMARIKEGAE